MPTTALRPARVTKRRAETRARLLDAAYRVFAEKGFGHVRIEDVCAAAGYTRGAFYSQFDSLNALFFTLYDQKAAVIADQVGRALSVDDDAFSLESLIDRISSTLLLDRDWLLIKTDFLMHAARNPEVAQRLIEHREYLYAAIEERQRAAGIELPPPLSDPHDAAKAVVAAYDGVAAQVMLDTDAASARVRLSQLLQAMLLR
jgi:AcrR family transcriptional regulator